ncbi:hypothetical protein PBAT_00320 [Paenibacillus antarcticus]|uniref:Uncharacterized protein n=1 Tax=Paenibacillus antarcticus TaxID=253703 RepID=A0A162MFH8_9BACL|nr:hypothetical protein PBAT_00320 [Paenibacillus antarcticus]
MCHCHRCRKIRHLKRKSRRLKEENKMLMKLISKIKVNVKIINKPKNINKNLLVNIDPDFTEAYAGGGVVPPVTP